jgi:hypothetical protein
VSVDLLTFIDQVCGVFVDLSIDEHVEIDARSRFYRLRLQQCLQAAYQILEATRIIVKR